MSTPNTWIIVTSIEDAPLDYTLGDGTPGSYSMTSSNTLTMSLDDEFAPEEINDGDTVVLNMVNIGSYDTASEYIKKIEVKIDVVLFIGSAGYGDEFSLVKNKYITTFSIRQQTGTDTSSGVMLSLYENSNLTTIDVDRFRLNTLYANDCPKLAGNLDLQYVTLVNIDDSISIIDVGYTNSSTTNQGITEITLPNKNINSISMANCNVITKLTFPDSVKTSLQELNVNGCTSLGNFNENGTQDTLDLSEFSALTTFKANNTLYTSVKFGNSISNISMKDCGNFESIEFSGSNISTLYLNDCSKLTSIPDLSTNNFSDWPTIDLSGTKITEINITGLSIGDITYPENMEILKIEVSAYDGILDLTQYNSLKSLTLDSCGDLTGIKTNGVKEKIELISLTNCESINIAHAGSSEIFIGDTTNGNFVLNDFSSLMNLTITNYTITTISLSSTNNTLETLDLSSSTCESINFPFETFTNITDLSLANCASLNTFNGNSNIFSTNSSTGLISIDLAGTLFNTVDMTEFQNIQKIILTDCPNLANLTLPSFSTISTLDLSNCSNIKTITDLSTDYFSITSTPNPTINLYGTGITSIKIDGLDLTEITYPAGMTELSINESPYNGDLNLSSYESLASLTLTSCGNLTGFNIYTNVTTLNLDSCANLTGEYNIPNKVTTCSIDGCGFTKITSNGKKSNLTLKALSQCTDINISNAGSSPIFIGGTANGEFALGAFTSLTSLTIQQYDVEIISLSSTKENDPLQTLDLRSSTCQTLSLPFNEFTNIKGIVLTNCEKLYIFNDKQQPYNFIADGINSLEEVNLLGTSFTVIKVPRSSSIKNIFIPLSATYVDMYELSNIKSFDMTNYKDLQYLEISKTGITKLVGEYTGEKIDMKIYATHDGFKSLTLSNRNITDMGFSTIGFSELICTSCSFKDNTLDLSNYTKLTNIGLNNCGLTAFTPNSTVVYLNISSNSLTGFTINGEPTTDITTLTSLQSLTIDNTGIISLAGKYESEVKSDISIQAKHSTFTSLTLQNRNIKIIDFNTDGFSTIDCESCSFENNTLDLSKYIKLTTVTLDNCGLTKFTPNTGVERLDISNNNSLQGFFINNKPTTDISNLTKLNSLNISGTSIRSLEISHPEAERRSISSLTLSKLTSTLTLGNINYHQNFSVPNSLKTLTLNNCGIEKVLSDDHQDEFSLSVSAGNFKSFDITYFSKIRNLQVEGLNEFTFIGADPKTGSIGGDRWNNTEIFEIAALQFSGLNIDLSGNKQIISRFNVISDNLETLSINGWNPSQNPNQTLNPDPNKSYINFTTDYLTYLALTNSKVDIDLPSFKEMLTLTAIDISGSKFETLDFKYESPNETLRYINASSSPLESISLENTNVLSELNLKDCTAFDGFIINGKSTNDISSLTSLQTLNISNTKITSLVGKYDSGGDFEMSIEATHETFTSLTLQNRVVVINFSKNGFTTINCNSCSFSDTFDLSVYNNLTSITLTSCGLGELKINTEVVTLNVSDNPLLGFNINDGETTTNLSSLTSLQTLNISGAQFTSLDLSYEEKNTTLTSIIATSSLLESISLANTDALTTLHLDETNIKSLDYRGTLEKPKLLEEILLPNSLTSLTLAYCTSLTSKIDPSAMTTLTTFKIPNCKQKGEMYFYSESLSDVDLSNNEISSVKLSGTITSLNLENNPISGDFSYSTDPQYYGINASSLSTLKLARTNITNVYIPAGQYEPGKTMGKITTLSLPSTCSYLNVSKQTTIKDLSTILGSCKKLSTLIADDCGLSGTLLIKSSLSTISLKNNSDLSTFDLSQYSSLTSFDLSGTSIANININSEEAIVKAAYPTSTENIIFTRAMFDESLKALTFDGNSENLKTLTLINTNITSLTCSSCISLESINLGPINTKTREVIGNTSLTYLSISDCDALETTSISSYSSITELYLTNCPELATLSVDELPELQNLELVNCKIFDGNDLFKSDLESTLPDLGSKLPKLQTLKMENTRIQGLRINNASEFVNLTGSLKGTDENDKEIGLINLDLAGCSKFEGVTNEDGEPKSFAEATPYLENLNVSGCSKLTNLDISNCTSLEQLDAHESGVTNITTSTNEQTALKEIDMSSTQISEINLNKYTNLQTIGLSSNAKIKKLEISNLESLTELKLDNNNLTTFSIDGCKKLENNYLQNLKITDSATFKNSGLFVPQGISTIAPSSLTITETDWKNFELNGALLNKSENSITIKLNNNLESLSFNSKPDSPTYKNLDISYNIKLSSINKISNIFDICRLLNANLIKFNDTDDYNNLNINLVMNAFTADDKTELPQYLGIWPQITDSDQSSGKLLGEINFTAAAAGKEVTGEFIGLHEDEVEEIDNLLQYSFNNITVWDAGNYKTTEKISDLSFGPILSVYVADVDGNVPDDSVNISVNGEDMTLTSIIETMFNDGKKPDIIYTNDKSLETLAEDKGIPVQILHTSTENWNPGYPYPNIFKIYFIMDNL